ncbi:MAG: FimB/Mfa2 family fimbrial subunit [Muribaculaceae bacterium]|nr:FimB/Mfa2 family fimbrial subunit [Muribaculaceae bacterium]
MKLKQNILTLLCVGVLTSCSAVYEDLDPCPTGADVRLTYNNNMQGSDLFDQAVHCAKLLLYDQDGNFIGEYDYNGGNTMGLDLPVGSYHAIAYGGMTCEDAAYSFTNALETGHHYSTIATYLNGTRAEVSDQLHHHFHGMADFTITEEDLTHIATSIDLTKNTNAIHLVLKYADNSPIRANYFTYTITADNALLDHANNIVKQNDAVVYHPYGFDTTRAEENIVKANFAVGRLQSDIDTHLTVKTRYGDTVLDLDLMKYLAQVKELELKDASLDEYLDRQDEWTLEFTLQPEDDKIAGLTFKINDWEIIINNFNL